MKEAEEKKTTAKATEKLEGSLIFFFTLGSC